MTIIIVVIMSILIAISMYTVSDKLSKVFIYLYLFWWFAWLFLSSFDVYSLFPVRMTTYMLIFLSLFIFLVGFLFGKSQKNIGQSTLRQINMIDVKSNKFLNVLLTLVFLILLYYFSRYIYLSTILPTSELRLLRFSVGALFTSTEQLLFFTFFIEAFIFFLYPIIAYQILHRNFYNYTFVIALLSLGLYAGIGSGRLPVIYLLMAILLMFFISKIATIQENVDQKTMIRRIKIQKTSIYAILIVFPLLLIYASYLTAFRLGESEFNLSSIVIGGNELMKQFIIYFTGPFRALDYGLLHYTSEIPLLYGQATFAGFNEILHAVFHVLGTEIPNINYLLGDYLQNRSILVGVDIFFNYAYTNIMIHYFDLGILGVIMFSFLFGFGARKAIFMFNQRPTMPSMVLVVYIFQAMVFSVFNWVFQSPAAVLTVLICLIWHYASSTDQNVSVQPHLGGYDDESLAH